MENNISLVNREIGDFNKDLKSKIEEYIKKRINQIELKKKLEDDLAVF